MIKVYLDWNVIAQMKDGHQNDLFKILSNKDKFFVPFSTAHIGDILSSYSEDVEQKKRIENDLEFITSLTNNLCFSNSGEHIFLKKSDPKLLFQQRVNDKDFMTGFSLDTLGEMFSKNGLTKEMGKDAISLIKSIPLDNVFKDAINNHENGKYLNQIFPGLKENPTMEGFFNSFGKMYQNLNEKEDYKLLREITQKGLGIKRDKIYNDDNPFDLIDQAHNKLGVHVDKYIDNSKNAPVWFNVIANEYIMLDMHGFQEDRVKVDEKKRKETFRNTTEDAFHLAFASTCNFYVTNDKKAYKKSKQVYDRLNINTLVLKPDEFIKYYNDYLSIENFIEQLNIVSKTIQTDNFIQKEITNGTLRTYILPFYLFNFFNSIRIIYSSKVPIFLLSRISATNERITYHFEIEKLVNLLTIFLGKDINNFGIIEENELFAEEWVGRTWKFGEIKLRLISSGGHQQLYFDLNK